VKKITPQVRKLNIKVFFGKLLCATFNSSHGNFAKIVKVLKFNGSPFMYIAVPPQKIDQIDYLKYQ